MTETVEQFDEAKERKTNIRLAVTIGGLSIGALIAFYISFFLVMLLRPGLLFSIMPIPDFPTNVLSDGQRVYFLSQRPDMSTVSFQEKQQPEMQHFISLLEGTKQGKPQSTPPYVTAIGGGGRILFLYQGGYRSFDGAAWNETATNAIGSDPEGVLTAEGLYVLSTFDDGLRIYRITDGQATSIPVPADLADEGRDASCLCPQMVWSGNALNLFWPGDRTITWATWNGSSWSQPITFPFQGAFRVLADDTSIYFFQRQANGPDKQVEVSGKKSPGVDAKRPATRQVGDPV